MEPIKNFVIDMNTKLEAIIKPIWDKIVDFLSKEYYLVYAIIVVLLVLLLLPGLVTILRKASKFFIFILVLLGIVFALWYFFIFKPIA
ncbi:MAG: hypothetical protein WCQ80_01115 [Bacilli bacterium]